MAKHTLRSLPALILAAMLLAACSETTSEWDPHANWKERNAQWYEQIADSARTSIARARAQHGAEWEENTEWLMLQTFKKAPGTPGTTLTDSVCVHILSRGEGQTSAAYTDTLELSFRAWIMPAEYENEHGKLTTIQQIFTQTYLGPFDPQFTQPVKLAVAQAITGLSTAMQYMVEGDDWLVYIPQELAYGDKDSPAVPAHSALVYRVHASRIIRRPEKQ